MIKLIVLDVDGCMTDGKIIYTNSGEEIKSFNVKDGFAIVQWIRLGGKAAIITGRKSKIVENRAKELGIHYLYQNVKNKFEILKKIAQKENIELKNIAAIGDELNDYQMLKNVGLSFAPKDGVEFIKHSVDITLSKKGGEGAVREMIEHILKRDGLFDRYLDFWIKGDS